MRSPLSFVSFSCLVFFGCNDPITDIAKSHIDANVPKGKLFDEYLKRDLEHYFCTDSDCTVTYTLLRDGPTQTGIAYPKYYVRAQCLKKQKVISEGAVRVAAVEQERFEVTNFLSRQEILATPSEVNSVLPAALVESILKKAHE